MSGEERDQSTIITMKSDYPESQQEISPDTEPEKKAEEEIVVDKEIKEPKPEEKPKAEEAPVEDTEDFGEEKEE